MKSLKMNFISVIVMLMFVLGNCATEQSAGTADAALALVLNNSGSKVTPGWKKFVQSSDKANIAYKVVGSTEANAKTVVVLHSMGFGSKYLEGPITKQLGDKYKLVFYDQRYVGNSTSSSDPKNNIDVDMNQIFYNGTAAAYPNVTVDKFVEDLENLRKELKLDKMNLLGHFWGGRLAMEYSIQVS